MNEEKPERKDEPEPDDKDLMKSTLIALGWEESQENEDNDKELSPGEQLNALIKEVAEKQEQIDNLKKSLEDFSNENLSLKKTLEKLDSENDVLKKDLSNFKDKIHELNSVQEQVKSLESERDLLKEENLSLREKVDALNEKIDVLNQDLQQSEASEASEAKEQELIRERELVKLLEIERDVLKEENLSLREKVDALNEKIDVLNQDLQQSRASEAKEQEREQEPFNNKNYEALINENNTLKKMIDQMQSEFITLKSQVPRSDINEETLQQKDLEISNLKAEKDALESRISEVKKQVVDLINENTKLGGQYNKLKDDALSKDSIIENLRREIESMREQISREKLSKDTLLSEKQHLLDRVAELEQLVESQKSELLRSVSDSSEGLAQMQQIIDGKNEEIDQLKIQLAAQEGRLRSLDEKIDLLEKDRIGTQAILDKTSRELEEFREKYYLQKDIISKYEIQIDDLKSQLNKY
ncbi:MAG: hypothetical protein ACTSVI_03565, partial [Promethearchaeota archaeon]